MADHDENDFSVASASEAARDGRLGEWVERFLASPGSDNAPLGEQLTGQPRWWLGPVRLPLRELNRLAGPPGEPVLCPIADEDWRDDVEELEERVDDGWVPPPLVVTYRDGQLVLEDGNHRVEGLRRAGVREAWAVVSFEDRDERDRFTVPVL